MWLFFAPACKGKQVKSCRGLSVDGWLLYTSSVETTAPATLMGCRYVTCPNVPNWKWTAGPKWSEADSVGFSIETFCYVQHCALVLLRFGYFLMMWLMKKFLSLTQIILCKNLRKWVTTIHCISLVNLWWVMDKEIFWKHNLFQQIPSDKTLYGPVSIFCFY